MSDTASITRRYPLDDAAARMRATAALSLEVAPPAARLSLRARSPEVRELTGQALGLALPVDACRFAERDGRTALWLGPDEWLVLAPGDNGPELAATLGQAIGTRPHSLVDVSERSTGIVVSGEKAATLLNAGCPLDLSLEACPVGFASRTVLAKSEIVLLRRAPDRFELDVWRSFAPYVWAYLREARREFLA